MNAASSLESRFQIQVHETSILFDSVNDAVSHFKAGRAPHNRVNGHES